MPSDLLHCTFFFAEETLRKLPAGRLTAWRTELKTLVHEAPLGELDVQLKLEGLYLFPTGKQTLIVARFAAPARLIVLHAAVKASADGRGIIHFTLCKIRASKIEVANIGARAIKTMQ